MISSVPFGNARNRVADVARGICASVDTRIAHFASALVQAMSPADGAAMVARADREGLRIARTNAEIFVPAGTHIESIQEPGRDAEGVALHLSKELVVARRMRLPTRNDDHIAAILRNRIDRLGPWPAEQALFGFRTIPDGDGKDVEISIAIAGRTAIEAWKSQLEAAGYHVDTVEAETADGAIVLERNIPLGIRRKAARLVRIYAAGIAILGLACVSSLGFAAHENTRLDALNARLGADTVTALAAGEGRPDPGEALLAKRQGAPPLLVALRSITRALPDGAWLTSLAIRNTRIELVGEAKDVPSLIGALQEGGFSDVAFSAPSMRSDAGRSSFAISARLAGGGIR